MKRFICLSIPYSDKNPEDIAVLDDSMSKQSFFLFLHLAVISGSLCLINTFLFGHEESSVT